MKLLFLCPHKRMEKAETEKGAFTALSLIFFSQLCMKLLVKLFLPITLHTSEAKRCQIK